MILFWIGGFVLAGFSAAMVDSSHYGAAVAYGLTSIGLWAKYVEMCIKKGSNR